MLIGYEITGYDNGSHMTGSCDKLFPDLTDIPKCDICGYRTDYRYNNQKFSLKRKTLDYSSTYDGINIVSLKFKEFCVRYGYTNLVFLPIKKNPDFFQFYIEGNILKYEARLKEKLCEGCNQYESIVGPSANLAKISTPLEDGFYQSDLWFASGNEKSPVVIIGPKTLQNLKTERLSNICVDAIEKDLSILSADLF
jgi:hypothetical protein